MKPTIIATNRSHLVDLVDEESAIASYNLEKELRNDLGSNNQQVKKMKI